MKKIIFSILGVTVVCGVAFFAYKAYKIIEYNNLPIWEKKINTAQDIKIGIITDTHVHPKRISRQGRKEEAPRYLNEKNVKPIRNFVKQMQKFQPEFIVHLGDVIEGTNDEDYVGSKGVKLVKKELDKTGVPVHWVAGNHDLRSLTKEQFKESLQLEKLNQVFDIGDYRFIILDANYDKKNQPRAPGANTFIPGNIPPEIMQWFELQLQTDKRVFIFMHQAVFIQRNKEDKNWTTVSIFNARDFQNLIAKYHVDGVFNGHIENRHFEQTDDTAFFSLTGTKKSEKYPDSYYELTITDGIPNVKMFYTTEDTGDEIIEIDFKTGPESEASKRIDKEAQEKKAKKKIEEELEN
jgi:alkaline phosphatase